MSRLGATIALPLCVIAGLVGCSRDRAQQAQPPAPSMPPAPVSEPPADAPKASAPLMIGTVLETQDASTYTYVKVKTDSGNIWAATNKFKVKVGDKVAVPSSARMENFPSPVLKRTFPVLYLSGRIYIEGEPDFPAKTN